MSDILQTVERAQALALAPRIQTQRLFGLRHDGVTLRQAAAGCRAAGFDPVGCAPELYLEYPETAALEMAQVLADVWSDTITRPTLNQALVVCLKTDGSRAWPDTEVNAAVEAVFPTPVARKAVRLAGNDHSYISVPPAGSLNTPSAITVEVWARAASFHGGNWQDAVLSRHADRSGWELRVGEAIPRMMITVNGTHFYAQPANPGSSPRLQAGQWYHLAGTYDGGQIVMYVNGQPWFTQPLQGGITQYGGQLAIGRNANPAWDSRAFNGDVREVRLWNVARTQAQIAAAMNAPLAGNEPGLAGYWPVNEGVGPIAHDQSGHHADGSIINGVWIDA